MTEKKQIIGGTWFRFQRYELSQGYLRPAKGAALEEYDPWAEYTEQVWNRELVEERPPNLTFLEIGARARQLGAQAYLSPPDNFIKQICEWCSHWGLLGLLPHQVDRVELAYEGSEPKNLSFLPQRTVHIRTDWGWDTQKICILPNERGRTETKVHLRRLDTGWREMEPIQGTIPNGQEPEWCQYFPSIPEAERATYEYPVPMSKVFWGLYQEPLVRFVRVARELSGIVESLSTLRPVKPQMKQRVTSAHVSHPVTMSSFHRDQVTANQRDLQHFLACVRPTTVMTDVGDYEFRWLSSSLLGSLALMCLLDLTNTRIGRCEKQGCGRFFRSNRSEAKYCSSKCKAAEKQRRYREGRKSSQEERK